MQLSGEVSKAQWKVLWGFGRVWARAIGDSKRFKAIDDQYLLESALRDAAAALFKMFDEEKTNSLPHPLPDLVKYKDPATIRQNLDATGAFGDSKKNDGDFAQAGISTGDVSSASARPSVNADPSSILRPSSHTNLNTPTTRPLLSALKKADLLAKLKEYDAANSSDKVLRRAGEEISKQKGEISLKSIEKMSGTTVGLIYSHLQTVAAVKHIAMTIGTTINDAIAKLEAVQMNAAPNLNGRSGVYDPPDEKKSTASKLMDKISGKSSKKSEGKTK